VIRALGLVLGLSLLLPVVETAGTEPSIPAYDRAEWLPDWADEDQDCQNTRQEVLARDAFFETTEWDARGCRVVRGWWLDPATGFTYRDPSVLDVDHTIPLQWAHLHGGYAWPREKKRAFANELRYAGALRVMHASTNREKGAKGPDAWLPKRNGTTACQYGTDWVVVLFLHDGLHVPPSVREALVLLLSKC
jgi:hypothetical protein